MGRQSFERLLRDYNGWEVTKLRTVNKPLSDVKQFLGKLVAKDVSHLKGEPFKHSYLEFALRDPYTGKRTIVRTEKDPTTNSIDGREGGVEEGHRGLNLEVPDNTSTSRRLTYGEFWGNSKDQHAEEGVPFYKYDLGKSNCQHFTRVSLRGNKLLTPEADEFINQKVEQIMPSWTAPIVSLATGAAQTWSDIKDSFHGYTQGLKDTIGSWFGYKPLAETPIKRHIIAGATTGSHYAPANAIVGESAA